MTAGLIRKARQVAGDPVLRRWLLRRLAGGATKPPAWTPHRPPYLGDLPGPGGDDPSPLEAFKPLAAAWLRFNRTGVM